MRFSWRIKLLSTIVLLALLPSSCTRELADMQDEREGNSRDNSAFTQGNTLVCTHIVETKTYADAAYKLFWEANDKVQVNGSTSTKIAINSKNASQADFNIPSVLSYPYCAGYPAALFSGYDAAVDTASVLLPASQTYVDGNFDPAAAVMLAYTEEGGMAFNTAVAYLKITVSGGDDADDIKSIRVGANDGQSMSGRFTAWFGPKCSLTANSKDYSSVTLTATSAVKQGIAMYIAIPAQNYSKGINFFMVDKNDHWCEAVIDKPFTAYPSAVYPTSLNFNKNGDYQGAGIYTAHDWMSFTSMADGDAKISGECPQTSSGNGNYDQWKDATGTVNMYADVNVPIVDWSSSDPDQRQGAISNWSTVFDAHGHTLSADTWRISAFQNIYPGGVIRNLKVNTTNFDARSNSSYGGNCLLAGYVIGGEINNCENKASITCECNSHTSMSGICRAIYAGKLIDCKNSGDLILNQPETSASANTYMGGIVAIVGKSMSTYSLGGKVEITRCINEGKVINNQTIYKYPQCYVAVGGIAGWLIGGDASNYAVFKDCQNAGEVRHSTPTDAGASNTSSSVGGIIGIAYTPNPTVKSGSTSTPAGRTVGYMYGGKALNAGDTKIQDGFYFEMTGCINRGAIRNSHHLHGTVSSGSIRLTVNAGGLIGTAIGMKDKHAKITGCKNYGTVISGNTRANVSRSFCNTVLGGLIGHAGSLDLDGCIFKGQLGDSTIETYCTGGIFGSMLSNCKAENCKLYFNKFYHTNANKGTFWYYGMSVGTVSTWGRDSGAFASYCSGCSFSNNAFGGHITANCYTNPADADISSDNLTTYFYNINDAANSTVKAYAVTGNTVWDGNE